MEIGEQKRYQYLNQYKILKTLGSGYSAEVKLALDQHANLVAIKQYKPERVTINDLRQQLDVMKGLQHVNIIQLIAVHETAIYKKQNGAAYQCFAIVLELAEGGQLFDFIAETGKFSERVTRTYFHQMMNGLNYLHQKGFAHRDMKPENILLSKKFVLKIADFGFSISLKGRDNSGILRTGLGTPGYRAPEVSDHHYEGRSVDIFAAGVILFIMYAGSPPFQLTAPNDPYYRAICEKKYDSFWKGHSRRRQPGYFSDDFKDLFVRMVAFNPKQRPSIQQIAKNPWVLKPICTHEEIIAQFYNRKKNLDSILQQREIENKKKKEGVNHQGATNRDVKTVTEEFLSIYNQQYLKKRDLPTLVPFQQDIVVKGVPAFSIALLKEFLQQYKLHLNEPTEEDIIGDETEILKVKSIEDNQNSQITVYLVYSYEVENTIFYETLDLQITLGVSSEHFLVLKISIINGSLFYFKKVVADIKTNCFAVTLTYL